MSDSPDLEARVRALEVRMEEVASDASAARHLAAARDRDLADFGIKVDANRVAINALGIQTAARFDEMERRFEQVDRRFELVDRRFELLEAKVDTGFAEVRGRLDATAAGLQQIAGMLAVLVDREGDS